VDKKVFVLYKITLEKFSISVIDEGKGFNYTNLPDPMLKKEIDRDHGKGLFIVKKYMDEVLFNERGNRVMIGKLQKQGS
jgi:serine/threonine-protein kinase RsbW